ncbi:hypothetical protein E2C01_071179 [Portunus trituberculatus]|uniref:Uncharacterized protein n=1 Tax=Portunus trituberculatus TaxID=210409 RepID=A0A5B7HWA2_PORTR|nr:hypothetical protein [Portunus trituberculatus]
MFALKVPALPRKLRGVTPESTGVAADCVISLSSARRGSVCHLLSAGILGVFVEPPPCPALAKIVIGSRAVMAAVVVVVVVVGHGGTDSVSQESTSRTPARH